MPLLQFLLLALVPATSLVAGNVLALRESHHFAAADPVATGHSYAIGNFAQALNVEAGAPNCGPQSPIVVPLVPLAQQYKLTSRTNGVLFDLNADGVKEQIALDRGRFPACLSRHGPQS